MELIPYEEPARTRRVGEQEITITPPTNLKIQTTGPGATTLLNEGPSGGKSWTILVRVEIKET